MPPASQPHERWSGGRRWRYALKLGSWPKLLVPALLGHAIGLQVAGGWSWELAGLGLLFTVADLCFIVLLNDWGDQEVDRIKRVRFPDGCSPKTIPDGILPATSLLRMGLLFGGVAVAISYGVAIGWDRPTQRP